MAQTHTPPQFRERVLANLNAHGWLTGDFPHESMRFLSAWAQAEGGDAEWDPLNSTLHVYAGSTPLQGTDYNSSGVANYDKPTYGVIATVLTLLNGLYGPLVGFLQAPTITAEEACDKYASYLRRWGTNPATVKNCLATTS